MNLPVHIDDLPSPAFRLPLIGDLWRIKPSTPVQSELEISKSLGAKTFQLELGAGRTVVVTTDSAALTSISDEEAWTKFLAAPFVLMREILTGRGLLTAGNSDPEWTTAHDALSPGFTKAAMQTYHPTMRAAASELCELWGANPGSSIDVTGDMNRLTLEVISRCAFSSSFDSLHPGLNGDNHFSETLTRTLRGISSSSNSLPVIAGIRKRRTEPQAHRLRDSAERIVQGRMDLDRQGAEQSNSDLLSRMCPVDGQHTPDATSGLDSENIVDQCITFLAAGNETTAGTLSFCLHYLSQDSALQQQVHEEADRWAEDPSYEAVASLRLTRRVVDEALRLWPVAPAYFRRARADTTMSSVEHGEIRVPKNTVVMALLLGAHRDPETWGSDASEFRPSRFELNDLRSHPDRFYRPFGVGKRSCIGRQFALHEAVLVLATILARFRVLPNPDYRLEVEEMITMKPRGLTIAVEER